MKPMQEDLLRRLLPFKACIFSHNMRNDAISAIDGTLFVDSFSAWVEGLREPAAPATAP